MRKQTMIGLVKTKKEPGNMELREVRIPEIGPHAVLLKIWGTGVCGSDVHIYKDEHPYTPPVIIGHEFSGIIEEVGKKVKNLKIGDRVVADLETEQGRLGVDIDGSYAQYMKVPAHLVHVLPDNVSLEEGVLVEPVVAVSHALLERTKVNPADFVVVLGPGSIGLVAVQIAKLFSPRKIAITGLYADKHRLQVAKEIGVDYTFFSEENPEEKIKELTDGVGADVVIDCSGGEKAITQATKMVRIGGWITILGLWGHSIKVNIDNIPYNNLTVRGSWGWAGMESGVGEIRTWAGSQSWTRAMKILDLNKITLKPLISHVLPLAEWKQALKICEEKTGVKVVLKPNQNVV